MQRIRLLLFWLGRAWPVLVPTALVAAHLLVLQQAPMHVVLINKVNGTILQMVGGLIVLHSINENLGTFRGQTLRGIALGWFRDFPLRKRVVAMAAGLASSTSMASALGSVSIGGPANTVEERVALLERQLVELRNTLTTQRAELLARVDAVRAELTHSIAANTTAISHLTAKLEKATVGGFKQQTLGVLLVIHGAVASAYS